MFVSLAVGVALGAQSPPQVTYACARPSPSVMHS